MTITEEDAEYILALEYELWGNCWVVKPENKAFVLRLLDAFPKFKTSDKYNVMYASYRKDMEDEVRGRITTGAERRHGSPQA